MEAQTAMYKKRVSKLVLFTALALLLLALLAVFIRYSNLPFLCVFNHLTGLRCPGCGNTRAVFACLRFRFIKAVRFNCLFPFEMLYILFVYAVSAKEYIKNGKYRYSSPCVAIDIIFLVLLAVWFILRNCLGI